jgi:hypothetical protein
MSDASTLFELLSARHRRRILLLLCNRDEIRIPEDLVSRGATLSAQGSTVGESTAVSRGSELETRLRHLDLPKLESCGLVEWDPDEQLVSRGPEFEAVEPALTLIAEYSHRFPLDLL